MNHVNPFIRSLVLSTVAFAMIGSAHAKWVVDQVYSNANGSLQFIVLHEDGQQGCGGFSVSSTHDGVTTGVAWDRLPSNLISGRRVLVATGGFERLGIVAPDFRIWAGFLGTGAGVIKFCDGVEFHYPSLPADGVMALDASGRAVPNVATNAAGRSGSVTAEQAASAGMGVREGHTGSWYDPAASGQGFELEFAGDDANFGAHVVLNWVTYDHSAAGGPEQQRWYTLQGHTDPSNFAAPLTLAIYRNVGGNFNAAPTTASEKVGSAVLDFTACDVGKLDYTFSDGSGRSGSIPIVRLTRNVTCFTTGAHLPANADFALSGNWYDPATSGQGIAVEINPVSGVAFLTWYTYAPSGAEAGAAGQRWYTAQSNYTVGARTMSMTIFETTGALFGVATPTPRSVAVGTATLAFQSCSAATLTYSFTGGSSAGATGVIALSRVIPVRDGCTT